MQPDSRSKTSSRITVKPWIALTAIVVLGLAVRLYGYIYADLYLVEKP